MNSQQQHDDYFMGVALGLAKRGLGTTSPNPSVGAVIVKEGRIIAAAHTAKGGRPHAEVLALQQAGAEAKGATLYVTLEPCCHVGVTPPCAEAVIAAQFSRIVIATQDSDPRVSGKAIARLKTAGIDIACNIREQEARQVNAGFFSVIERGLPLVTVKLATTLDGKIASMTGKSRWITGPLARNYAHLLRTQHEAIMVGIGTLLADDPTLTCRLPGLESRSPLRVVVDSTLKFPLNSALFKTRVQAPVWIITCKEALEQQHEKATQLQEAGLVILTVEKEAEGQLNMHQALQQLAARGVTRLLVEGGGTLVASLIREKLVDSLIWIHAPLLLGDEAKPAVGKLGIDGLEEVVRWRCIEQRLLGDDRVELYQL